MKNLPLFFLCLFLACGDAPPVENTVDVQKAANSDQVVKDLSRHIIADPKTQAEKDQNTIVTYAMEKSLVLKRSLSGMYYQIIEPGEGEPPTAESKVSAHYEGQLLDGTIFDSSYQRGEPLNFKLRQVIRGWQEGLKMLRPGGKGVFLIPSRLAYVQDGFGSSIPPNTVLLFKVELLAVQ
ncbi:MAG: FKBP-type peptidyl-prolyl cis-trans isomerase [Bacteroidota bacterium]